MDEMQTTPPNSQITGTPIENIPSPTPPVPIASSFPKKDFFSNTWRNVVALILLVMSASLTLFFLHNQNKMWQAFEAWAGLDFIGLLQKKNFSFTKEESIVTPVPPPPPIPTLVGTLPLPEEFTAGSILVKDTITGEVLFKKNEYEKRPIASLSKLLSALVVLEKNPDWQSTTTIKKDPDIADAHFLNGETYTLEDVWNAALVGSSNQAILSLVDAIFGDRITFAVAMNQKALEIGMQDSVFVEPTGLSSENISTASDVVLLLDEALRHTKIQETLLLKEITISPVGKKKPHHIWSTNWLLLGWIPNTIADFRGGKTGYITASGYNFGMQIAQRDEKVIDVVILGASKHELRFSEARDIGKAIFESYQWPIDTVTSTVETSSQ
jgi:D-alanyl-D-alanine carboxypeptidase